MANFKHILFSFLIGFILGLVFIKFNPSVIIDCEDLDCYKSDTVKTIEYLPGDTVVKTVYKTVSNTSNPVTTIEKKTDTNTIYIHEYQDTNFTAKVTSLVKGVLDSQSLSYTVTVPEKYITVVDTVKINNNIYIKPQLYHRVYVGSQITATINFLEYGANLAYQNPKNNWIYEAGYKWNSVAGNNVTVGLKVPLFKIKKK